jgi:hypothetical protein
MQCACIVLYCQVVCLAPQYFSTLSHKRHDFREKVIEHKMRVLVFSTNFSENFLFFEEMSEIWSKMCIGHHVKYPLFLSFFDDTWIVWSDFGKVLKYKILWKSPQWGADLFNAYRRTDGHNEADSRLSQFCERAKNKWIFVSVKQNVTVATLK